MSVYCEIAYEWKCLRTYDGRMENSSFAPSGIAVLPTGEVWVTDEVNHCVCRYDAQLNVRGSFGKRGSKPGEFVYPVALQVGPQGVYVVDKWNHRIQLFSYEGEFVRAFGSYGDTDGCFNEPCSIALSDGKIVVADKSNGRVQVIKEGTVLCKYENHDPLPEFYSSLSFQNSLYYKNWMVGASRYNSVEAQFRRDGFKVGLLEYPEVVVFSPSGTILVVDRVNYQAVEFTTELQYVKTHTIDNAAITTICCDAENGVLWYGSEEHGDVWCEGNHGVEQYSLGDVRVSALVVRGDTGYVADFWNGRVYQFKRSERT